VPVTTWSNLLLSCHGMDLFLSHFPISSLLSPSRRRKYVLQNARRRSPHSLLIQIFKALLATLPFCTLSSLKLPLFSFFEASVPSFDACSQRWLLRNHTRAGQCFAAAALAPCSLAHPACFRRRESLAPPPSPSASKKKK